MTYGLTPREIEVMVWAACGKSTEQTAEILGITWRSVTRYRSRVLDKMGAANTTAAAVMLVKAGEIDV